MTSKLLSQIFNKNSQSIYETLRENHANNSDSDLDDLETRAGMLPNQEGPDQYEEGMDDNESSFELRHQPPAPASSSFLAQSTQRPFFASMSRPRGNRYTPRRFREEDLDDDDDVPASLLFETGAPGSGGANRPSGGTGMGLGDIGGGPGPATEATRKRNKQEQQWAAATAQMHTKGDENEAEAKEVRRQARLGLIDPKERALWKWANVENLDNFLNDVYDYFLGKGIYSIALNRLLNLLTLAFVVAFSTFLSLCIDYQLIRKKDKFGDVIVQHCMSRMSGTATFFLWVISFYWAIKAVHFFLDMRRLWDIHNFYTYLLEIPDQDMQTVSWQEVVARLMILRDDNPTTSETVRRRHYTNQSKQRMDAHDIANRLMRKENYLIALFNKEILDLTIPIPFLRNRGSMLTKTLEWNLSLTILDYVFNEQGQMNNMFLKEGHRRILSDALKVRFKFAGWMNIITAPFIATYFLLVFLLRNVHDFIKTPARIGHRQYTPLAEWKFREFNELHHLFHMRLDMSYPAAEAYVDQFPKEKTAQVARFVSFVAGSLLGVLAIASLLDSDLIQGFEITPGMTALTYMAILTTIVAVTRGMLPEENTIYDPEWSLRNVIQHTHYMPDHWKEKLRSDEVKRDFMTLYDMKVSIFINEILSVFFTPFILWWSLPKCSDRIIDFFREFTVHVDGIGYVCSFAVFNFQKPGHNVEDLREEYFSSKDNKMLSSYLGFMDQYHGTQIKTSRGGRQHQGSMRPYMTSPIMAADMNKSMYSQRRQETSGPGVGKSMHRDSPGRMGASMMQSSLLDPQHQPIYGAFSRNMRQPMFHPRSAESLREEDEEEESLTKPGHNGKQRYRSNLGESFMSTNVTTTMMEIVDEGQAGPRTNVLDLLNQFVGGGAENAGRPGVI